MTVIAKNTSIPIKLDLYDKKLIYLLSQDMRTSQRELAHKLRISPERVHYKVNRLIDEILSPAMNLDLVMLGMQNAVILVERLEQDAAEALLQCPDIIMYFRILSRNQYLIVVSTINMDSFSKKYLSDAHFTVHDIITFIPDDYNAFNLDMQPIPLPKRGDMTLDKRDYKILAQLAENPVSSLLEISKATNIDRNTIRSRIEGLKRSGIILKFRYGINMFKIGMLIYFIRLQMSPSSKKRLIPFLRSDRFSGFIYDTLEGLFMFYMPPDQSPLFDFTNRIAAFDPTVRIEILQAADYFKVEPLPRGLISILKAKTQ